MDRSSAKQSPFRVLKRSCFQCRTQPRSPAIKRRHRLQPTSECDSNFHSKEFTGKRGGGRVPVVAVCVLYGQLRIIASQNRQLCKRKKSNLHKRLVKFSVRKAKSRKFPEATHMPTSRHFLGTTAHQTYIIKCRNQYVQSAVLMFTYHEKE